MWQKVPKQLSLSTHSVHIWLVNCQNYFADLDNLFNILSSAEQLRADRFKFKIHRDRFIINRANLRIILGRYLAIYPEKIVFDYTDKGKPFLKENINCLGLNFNVSHSQDYVIYGVSKNLIGVDLEEINQKISCQELAERFFCARESQVISSLSKPDMYRAFYLAWTSKEAYLKAIGVGLGGGLDHLELELLVKENKAKIIKINEKNYTVNDWQLFNWVYPENFIASVVILSQQPIEFRYYELENY